MEIGKKLSGRYKIIGTVGGGGMANVYLAHDLILDRDVAVKVLRYDFREDKDIIRRFQREALSATELVHPNIVSVYDVGEEDNFQYIVMEYVKGTDLKKYIGNHFPIPYQKVIDIMEQILSAVADAHRNRIIHRDLKPQNVLIDETGLVKITDFGIAVALSETSITQTNSLLGSVHYLSPEQARGSMATKQSDIYALGIILYELLTGNVPFEGESAVSIALKHFQETVPSVKDFDGRIPQPLENVVLKATAKEASDRYQSAEEMATDIATALSPQRAGEPKFEPASMMEETKVLTPIPGDLLETESVEAEEVKEEDEQKPVKDQKKKSKKKKIILFSIIGVILLFVIGFFAIAMSGPKDVKIPDLTGLSEAEAKSELINAKLKVGDVTEEANPEVEEGQVIRSDPKTDRTVKENTKVNLFISTGKATEKFGNFVGEDFQVVKAKLTNLKYDVRTPIEVFSPSVPKGQIIEQSIEKGQEVVPSETQVVFTISKGEEGFIMPDMLNYGKKDVDDIASAQGLKVTYNSDYSDTVTAGLVMAQTPGAGETVFRNDSITVTLSKGPKEIPVVSVTKKITLEYLAKTINKPASTTDSSNQSANSSSSEESISSVSSITEPVANKFEVYIEDEENNFNTPVVTKSILATESIDLTFKIKEGGVARYKVVRDGETIINEEVRP